VLDHLEPARIIDPLLPAPKSEYAELVEAAAGRGIRWVGARAGDAWELDGVLFRVLHPADLPQDAREGNASSVVLLVSWRDFTALLTGDAYVEVERAIADQAGDVDVLKVGHHGSTTSTDSTFLTIVKPEVALVSVGRWNRYGHPAPAVLRRLAVSGARIYRTDHHGSVRVVARPDGALSVTTEVRVPPE
jgi:competence protein ComEC